MSTLNEEVKVEGVYGGVQMSEEKQLPVKRGFWSSMKAFWLQEIDWNMEIDWNKEINVELTPGQQRVEDELNEFLHQEVTWEKFRNFLMQPVTITK